jgi:hypothetical protein
MRTALVAVLLCGGCATIDCGTVDWFETGQRDGRLGADSQADGYAARCPGIDRARYEAGLQSGLAMRPRIAVF